MINDPKIWMIAFVGGILPSILWLWFWLKEDRRNPEPKTLLTIIFIMGMLTGHLRFLGATLLHTISSGVIGISMGLSFFMTSFKKKLYVLLGIILAISCLLYTSDAADDLLCVDLGGRRII